MLASPQRFFVWTPLAAIAIAGLAILALRAGPPVRRVAACALLMVAAQIYVSGSVESWTVAGAFGQRRFVRADPADDRPGGGARGRVVVEGAGGDRDGALRVVERRAHRAVRLRPHEPSRLGDLRKNAYDAFVTVPRMIPDLAGRYLFDHESFYRRDDERHLP